MTRRWDAVTVGQIYIDHVFSGLLNWPSPGEEVFTRNYIRELGGGAAITACGLGRLGRKTAVFGVVGEVEGEWIRQRLSDFSVDASNLRLAPGSSGVTVSVSVRQDRSFYSYAGANELLDDYLSAPEVVEQLQQARHVHFAVPLDRHHAELVLPALKDAGCSVSLDVGWQPEWYMRQENLQTCREIDYFLPNRKEAEYLTGEQRPEEVLLGLEDLGFTHVVVKMGPEGAAIHTNGNMLQVPSPDIEVIDTTGAGDAFDAGLIDAVLDGADSLETLRRAATCGALSTRTAGALKGLATRNELEILHEQT
jgi:sugar/nucleoside kinase (ribokinase family)